MMHGTTDVIDETPAEPARPAGKLRLRRLKPPDVPATTIERFRRACGQKTACIVRVSSSHTGSGAQAVLWDRPSLIVGRGADCDLRLSHTEISRQHAYFQRIDDRIFCADLGSRTGTHWSGGAAQSGWVPANEPVSLGPYSLTFEPAPLSLAAHAVDELLAEEDLSADGEEADFDGGRAFAESEAMYLDFMNAGPKVRRFRVGRAVTLIGSGEGVKYRLSNPSISNVHCAVVRTPTGLWVVDLLSADGTIVNGQIEPIAPLQSGDEFQLGRFLVAVHYGAAEDNDAAMPAGPSGNGRSPQDPDGQAALPSRDAPAPAAEPGHFSALNELAHLASGRQQSGGVPSRGDGLSEEFVLNIVRELGVMQQQALQHAQQSMRETLHQLSTTYQQRIDALEHQHAALRDQLHGFVAESAADGRVGPRLLARADGQENAAWDDADGPPEFDGHTAPPPSHPFAPADQEAFDDIAPEHREQWIREQIKTVEAELDKTRRGWGKKLVDLLGY